MLFFLSLGLVDIVKQLNESVTEDVVEDFTEPALVVERFARWRQLSPQTYANAYVPLSLPKLLAPLVRVDLIDWNPLERSSELDTRRWFVELVRYARDLGHDDLLVIPHIVEKTVLVKLSQLAEAVYDPFSSSQTMNFASLVAKFAATFPTLNSQSVNTKVTGFFLSYHLLVRNEIIEYYSIEF